MQTILIQVILSLLIIVVIHYVYFFLKNEFTKPKIKDLVHIPKRKYEDMYNIIHTKISVKDMKSELDEYLTTLTKES